ncbi:MAG: enoyl-CoA hydratase-related protein, partial [Chloroflexi bacterium]|nr:enoyl-CoA hydratase-related protein [Chloroflexota bacterium]
MSDLPLIYEKDPANKRCVITFNRPERMNAMSLELLSLLRDATEDFNSDPDLWVAIITGAGERAFCAGADLSST